jgi:hypothetical protein
MLQGELEREGLTTAISAEDRLDATAHNLCAAPEQCGASFAAKAWPLSALHPEAPSPAADWWHDRLEPLVERFGAQHVANAVAAIFLSPWHSERFDASLRLASRKRMLEIAARVAARDAMLVVTSVPELWTEHAAIASLPRTRLVQPRSWRRTHLTPDNIGEAWDSMCQRIEVHAWL